MAEITLYHGTAFDFYAFDDEFHLRGSSANSALGIHLTECPALAAEYAELATNDPGAGYPRVLSVVVNVSKVAVVSSRDEFFGLDKVDETPREREDFSATRKKLMNEGFEAVACEYLGEDLVGAWVVFDPYSLQIENEITIEAALTMDSAEIPNNINFSGVSLFEKEEDMAPENLTSYDSNQSENWLAEFETPSGTRVRALGNTPVEAVSSLLDIWTKQYSEMSGADPNYISEYRGDIEVCQFEKGAGYAIGVSDDLWHKNRHTGQEEMFDELFESAPKFSI